MAKGIQNRGNPNPTPKFQKGNTPAHTGKCITAATKAKKIITDMTEKKSFRRVSFAFSEKELQELKDAIFALAKKDPAFTKIAFEWSHKPPEYKEPTPPPQFTKAHNLQEAIVLKNEIMDAVLEDTITKAHAKELLDIVKICVDLDLNEAVKNSQDIDSFRKQ